MKKLHWFLIKLFKQEGALPKTEVQNSINPIQLVSVHKLLLFEGFVFLYEVYFMLSLNLKSFYFIKE